MSNAGTGPDERHGHVRDFVGRLHAHHHDEQRALDDELSQDAEAAGYDLEVDLAHPGQHRGAPAAFDLDTDIGLDNERGGRPVD